MVDKAHHEYGIDTWIRHGIWAIIIYNHIYYNCDDTTVTIFMGFTTNGGFQFGFRFVMGKKPPRG